MRAPAKHEGRAAALTIAEHRYITGMQIGGNTRRNPCADSCLLEFRIPVSVYDVEIRQEHLSTK